MSSLYVWLNFGHLLGLGLFLFGHGISGGVSFALRPGPPAERRSLLQLSIWSYRITYPGLILLVATGIWMGFLGSFWGRGWIWTAIVVLVAVSVVMGALSVPFHRSRDAGTTDTQLDEWASKMRPGLLAGIGALGLLALLFLMVFKPF